MNAHRALPFVFALVLIAAGAAPAQGPAQLVWSQWPSSGPTVPSQVNATSNLEAADDFDFTGTVNRVVLNGAFCAGCYPFGISATIRFYQWQAGAVGPLQYQASVNYASGLGADPTSGMVEVPLAAPFAAAGRHWVSVQIAGTGTLTWSVERSNAGAPALAPAQARNVQAGGAWAAAPGNADLALLVLGIPAAANPPADPCGSWSAPGVPGVSGSSNTMLLDVKAIAANDAWAVGRATISGPGSSSTVNYAVHWDGTAWTPAAVPSPSPGTLPPNCALQAVDALASDDVWAGGGQIMQLAGGWTGTQVLVVHWNGSQWSVVPNTPVPFSSVAGGASGAQVHAIEAIAPNDVWFAGRWIEVNPSTWATTHNGLLTHWDGSSFTQMNVPIVTSAGGQVFDAIDSSGPNDVWAVGRPHSGSSPDPVCFHWDGSQWTSMPPPGLGMSIELVDVDVLAPGDVWILGRASPLGLGGFDFLYHWNGSSWSFMPGPAAGATSIAVDSPSTIFAAGSGVWYWDGTAWTQVQTFTGPGAPVVGLQAFDWLGTCQSFVAGFVSGPAGIQPFAAHVDNSAPAWTLVANACAPGGAPATLAALTAPRIGQPFTVAIDDPSGALGGASAAISHWIIAALPSSAWPCGDPLPVGGAGGGPGEVFIAIPSILLAAPPALWVSGQGPALHTLAIPLFTPLIGIDVYTQGVLVDAAQPANLILTNGLAVHIGL